MKNSMKILDGGGEGGAASLRGETSAKPKTSASSSLKRRLSAGAERRSMPLAQLSQTEAKIETEAASQEIKVRHPAHKAPCGGASQALALKRHIRLAEERAAMLRFAIQEAKEAICGK